MIELGSDYSKEELISRWDDYTSAARFAGSDETLDLIFVSKRSGDRIKLIRKSNSVHEPYAAVFRGRIYGKGERSCIKGIFTKTVIDYAFTALIIALAFVVRSYAESRGASLYTANVILAAAIVFGILLLFNYRGTKRRYTDFMCRITGRENELFRTRGETKEAERKENADKNTEKR